MVLSRPHLRADRQEARALPEVLRMAGRVMTLNRSHLTNPTYSVTRAVRADRRIDSKAVACPTCSAQPGEACALGKPHKTRRRMAIRALNDSYTPVDRGWFASLTPGIGKALRRRQKVAIEALAADMGVPVSALRKWETGRVIPIGPEGSRYERWLRAALGESVEEPAREVSL